MNSHTETTHAPGYVPPSRVISDQRALDYIVHILRDPEWGVGMLEDICAAVTEAGRNVTGTGEPTWDRH